MVLWDAVLRNDDNAILLLDIVGRCPRKVVTANLE